MADENITMEAMDIQGGKITFAPEVIATIATLAVNEVEGVDGMGGTMVEGLTGILNKKNLTKGIKVELNENTSIMDINIVVKYGYKIHEVSNAVQRKVKSTIETMTGLEVAAVNVYVQSVAFSQPEKTKAAEAPVAEE